MSEKKSTRKKPLSLNDSHYHLLQDLASPPTTKPKPSSDTQDIEAKPSQVKLEDRNLLYEEIADYTIPQFSAITDFDSSPEIPVKANDRSQFCQFSLKPEIKEEDDDNIGMPRFSALTNDNVPIMICCQFPDTEAKSSQVKLEGRNPSQKIDDDTIPQFSAITDFDSPPAVQEKPVKTDDRSQFCQFSLKPEVKDEEDDNIGMPRFSKLINFENVPYKEVNTKVKMEGRRRLCKISSRDEDMAGKKLELDENYSDLTDFDSPHITSKNVSLVESNGTETRNEIRDILKDLNSKLEILSIEPKKLPRPEESVEESFLLAERNSIGEGNMIELPEYSSAASSFSLTPGSSDSSSDATTNSGLDNTFKDMDGKEEVRGSYSIENVVSLVNTKQGTEGMGRDSFFESVVAEKTYLEGDSQGDRFVKRVNASSHTHGEASKNTEAERSSQIELTAEIPFLNIVEDESDNDDCVIVSGIKFTDMGKEVGEIEGEDNGYVEVQHAVSRDEESITLSGPNSTYKLSGEIAKILYPHQRDGLRWLWSLHCQNKGGILGDDMGLGKTMQICAFLAGLFHSNLIKRVVLVAPKTLLPHWIKELSVVGLSQIIREYFGTCTKARQYELQCILQGKGVLLTTYDIVRNNSKALQADYYYGNDGCDDDFVWDYMILDEGHLIKNPSTQRAKSLYEIPSAHRIIISGTPIQNNLKELWALFNFCCPDLLGDNKWFKDRFEAHILRGNEKNASDREKRIGSTVAKELRDRIEPYFLRRLKSEVFNEEDNKATATLSKKNEMIIWLRLTSCQRQLYEAFLNSEIVLSAFDGSPLAALTILKKICDHPLLLTKRAAEDVLEGMDSMLKPDEINMAEKLAMHVADIADPSDFEARNDVSCKISFIMSLLDNLIPKGHYVLIFSQTRKMLNLIQDSLKSEGYDFQRIDGTTKPSDRLRIVNDFQEGIGAPIFLLTSQVGGLGLTLTKADRVIVVDPAWNPSTDNQSVDRAYRIGQKKDVFVYRLMTCGTVEEKIYRKQVYKGGLFKTATEHKEQMRYFSQQDLKELFSLPKQGFDISLTQQQLDEEHDSQNLLDESLMAHVEFLKHKGIVGVSHHSLLFSKTTPLQLASDEEVMRHRIQGENYTGNSSSSSSLERPVDGAEFASKPKDVTLRKKISSPDSDGKLTESEIRDKIKRLSQTLAHKDMISRLPDKGSKLRNHLAELNSELHKIMMTEKTEVIVEDISGALQSSLYL